MTNFKKVCDIIEKILILLVAVFAAVMITITTIEVVRRYFFSQSFQWAEELSRYLMIGVAFLGAAVGYRKKDLVPLDLITSHLSPRLQLIIELIMEIVSFVILAALLYFSFKTVSSPIVYRQISIGLPISMAIPFATMPIGFTCMILFAVEHFMEMPSKFREVK
jgi:TRAP-type C4-dicarboxylate transport system permease small subunit